MYNKLSIVCSSQNDFSQIRQHAIQSCGLSPTSVEFLGYTNKGEYSLSEIYNKGLSEAKYQHIVFMHHDIKFNTSNWGRKLLKHFDRNSDYGIIGVAGTNHLISGTWWEDKGAMHGIVNHSENGKIWTSRFSADQGNKLKPMVVLDGVFFAVDKEQVLELFDEDFKGFHFYDLGFTLPNYLRRVKIGVCTDIRLTHMSVGRVNETWHENKKQFEEKYKSLFPLSV